MEVLRNPRFPQLLDVEMIEEAKLADGIEFRYGRKTTWQRWGRNYFLKVSRAEDGTVITVTIQSRKRTVLFDPAWKQEAEKALNRLEVLMELLGTDK